MSATRERFASCRCPGRMRRRDSRMAPAAEARQQLGDGGDGRRVVDVVEDHQPARMVLEPAERGGDLHRVLARVFFRQIENVRPGRRRQARVERRRRVGAQEQKRRMLALMLQGVFDRQPRLADPAQPMQRPPNDRSPSLGAQRFVKLFKSFLTSLEEGAERGEGEVFRAALGEVRPVLLQGQSTQFVRSREGIAQERTNASFTMIGEFPICRDMANTH